MTTENKNEVTKTKFIIHFIYNIQNENNNDSKENTDHNSKKKLISVLNADFTDKNTVLNSPRSLEACLRLGIEVSELIQTSMEEFKNRNPEIRNFEQKIIQLRYNAMEKFRLNSIEAVKKERQNIINEIKNEDSDNDVSHRKNITYSKGFSSYHSQKKMKTLNNYSNNETIDKKMEKIFADQKKAIAKIKQKQRLDIQSLIKSQIKRELSEKLTIEKERRYREKEEENIREISRKKEIKEKKLKQKELKRQSDLSKMLKEQQIKYKLKEEKERKRICEMIEAEKIKKAEQKKN